MDSPEQKEQPPKKKKSLHFAQTGKYKRLKELGEERYFVVENHLRAGKGPSEVAQMIQKEWGEFSDVAEKTLIQQLNRFRWEILASPEIIAKQDRALRLPKSIAYKEQIAVLSEMERLAMLQKARVDMAFEQEKKVKMLMKGTSQEVLTMMSLLKDIQKQRFDLGLDLYSGPVVQGLSSGKRKTTLTDGTVVEEEVVQAMQTAAAVLDSVLPGNTGASVKENNGLGFLLPQGEDSTD